MSFRIKGLPAERFSHLFAMPDEELAKHHAVRRIADDRQPGYPCRVSLSDSKPGDELLLVNYEHLPVDSPYRMRFAIYVREGDPDLRQDRRGAGAAQKACACRQSLRRQRHDAPLRVDR